MISKLAGPTKIRLSVQPVWSIAICIPLEAARELPALVRRLVGQERKLIEFCRSPEFTPEGFVELRKKM